jgi:hypothetical protein
MEGDALDTGPRGSELETAPGGVAMHERLLVPGSEHGIVVGC